MTKNIEVYLYEISDFKMIYVIIYIQPYVLHRQEATRWMRSFVGKVRRLVIFRGIICPEMETSNTCPIENKTRRIAETTIHSSVRNIKGYYALFWYDFLQHTRHEEHQIV